MRLNKFVALSTGMSRRAADKAIESGRVSSNGIPVQPGQVVADIASIMLDGQTLSIPQIQTIILNKPRGFVCSRNGQGNKTIYDLLPAELHHLKPIGRLDKDSSGLILLTNDGSLAHQMTHPKFAKEKLYKVKLDKTLASEDEAAITRGVALEDGISRLALKPLNPDRTRWEVRMSEGRNRQIRRTFAHHSYKVIDLDRTKFGEYTLDGLEPGKLRPAES